MILNDICRCTHIVRRTLYDLHCATYIVRRTLYALYVNVHKDMLEPAIPSVTPVTPIEPYCYVNDFDIRRRGVFLYS